MDRQWIKNGSTIQNRLKEEYKDGVKSFIEVAKSHVNAANETRCPCIKCLNTLWHPLKVVHVHLIQHGMSIAYLRWIFHGEPMNEHIKIPTESPVTDSNCHMFDMVNDLFNRVEEEDQTNVEDDGHMQDPGCFEKKLREAQRELYSGCTEYTVLSYVVELIKCKVDNLWTNKSVDQVLEIMRRMSPKPNNIPESYYACKKILRGIGLGYESIHACKYHCALFYKEHAFEDKCPVCNEPRYKNSGHQQGKKVPQKVLRYFPLKPRLQRLFMSRHTATDMRWHVENRVNEEGVMRHPADSVAWKEFDKMYPAFASDPRNVRVGLATDGFNPYGNMSMSYSMWPVVVIPYNLPPWKCMKKQYSMLTLLIPGPQSPGNDIDVFLRPLVDELVELWEKGVETYDKSANSLFNMRAAVMWTINDFPAYANLSGWSTKGYLACPVCNEETPSTKLTSKIGYTGHRRFLPTNHSWRKDTNKNTFNGKRETRPPPREFSGEVIVEQLENLVTRQPGKHPDNKDRKRKRTAGELNWTKKAFSLNLNIGLA